MTSLIKVLVFLKLFYSIKIENSINFLILIRTARQKLQSVDKFDQGDGFYQDDGEFNQNDQFYHVNEFIKVG